MIRTDTAAPMAERLADLFIGLTQVIEESRPDVVAVESVFTNRNLQTAISVGRASGVALLAAARAGLRCPSTPQLQSNRRSPAMGRPPRARSKKWLPAC